MWSIFVEFRSASSEIKRRKKKERKKEKSAVKQKSADMYVGGLITDLCWWGCWESTVRCIEVIVYRPAFDQLWVVIGVAKHVVKEHLSQVCY